MSFYEWLMGIYDNDDFTPDFDFKDLVDKMMDFPIYDKSYEKIYSYLVSRINEDKTPEYHNDYETLYVFDTLWGLYHQHINKNGGGL